MLAATGGAGAAGGARFDLSPPLFVQDTVRMMAEIVELYKNSNTAVEDALLYGVGHYGGGRSASSSRANRSLNSRLKLSSTGAGGSRLGLGLAGRGTTHVCARWRWHVDLYIGREKRDGGKGRPVC